MISITNAFFIVAVGTLAWGNASPFASQETKDSDCVNVYQVLDSLQKKKSNGLVNWLRYYGINATPEHFNAPEKIKTEYLLKGSIDIDEIDSRSLAISPDNKRGITYDGYFIDLSETPADEIGFDDSHDIDLYDFESHRIHRIHFKGLAYSTDELFWLDNHRFMLLGAMNTGQENQWVPYIQITNLTDSSSCIYRYKNAVNDVAPFDYLLNKLKRPQTQRDPHGS